MNICCIYSIDDYYSVETPLSAPSQIPFGISMIGSVLKAAGFEVGLLVLTADSDLREMIGRHVRRHRPSLFCLTAVSSQFDLICRVARTVKEIAPGSHVVLGGHHATLNPEHAIGHPYFDSICVGEGEAAVIELATAIRMREPISGIANLWIRNGSTGAVERNPVRPFIQELDSLPFVDRAIWKPWIYDNNRMTSVLVGRGCPYRCAYCSNHVLSKMAEGKYVRYRSTKNIVEELSALLEADPSIANVYLEAESLGANTRFTYELLDVLERFNSSAKKRIRFGCNFTPSRNVSNNEALFARLRRANFSFINVGLESGSERIRNQIRRPKYSNAELRSLCGLAAGYGIQVYLFVLVGIPGETEADFEDTIKCVREAAPENVYLSIYYPYPGTDLYRTAKEMHLLDSFVTDGVLERRRALLDLPNFSRSQIQWHYYLFYYNAFKRTWPLSKVIIHSARTVVGSHPGLERLYRRLVGLRLAKRLRRALSSASR